MINAERAVRRCTKDKTPVEISPDNLVDIASSGDRGRAKKRRTYRPNHRVDNGKHSPGLVRSFLEKQSDKSLLGSVGQSVFEKRSSI